jgi:hypothetical protein
MGDPSVFFIVRNASAGIPRPWQRYKQNFRNEKWPDARKHVGPS